MSPPTIYVGSSLAPAVLIVGTLAVLLILVVGCCGAINL